MDQPFELPNVGDHFRNPENTEIYQVTLAGDSSIWVNVLDFENRRYFVQRPYGTTRFLKEMIPLTTNEVAAYGKEKFIIIQEYVDTILKF